MIKLLERGAGQRSAIGPQALRFDLPEYSDQEMCVAVPLGVGGTTGCVAQSLPVSQRHRLLEVARILSDQAAGLLLSLLLASAPPTVERGRQDGADHRQAFAGQERDPEGGADAVQQEQQEPSIGRPCPIGDH